MLRENFLTVAVANLAGLALRPFLRRPVESPRKALILKPCCISQVMLATPLLAALSEAYPSARFDWAVSKWARPAVVGNPRLSELIDTGRVTLADGTWDDVRTLTTRLRQEEYDTCFIPSRSSLLSFIAWRAGIPQRIGLNASGRGFAHTFPVDLPPGEKHEAAIYLSLAEALRTNDQAKLEFYPSDADREAVTQRLEDEVGWRGIMPLVILHPGGGSNPVRPDFQKRWPVERYALLGSRLARRYGACVVLAGSEHDRPLTETVNGLMSVPALDLAGKLRLGELGAFCEVADLYVGNDTGPTHIAAAVGCPTLAIYGPSDPAVSKPFATNGKVVVLEPEASEGPFSWEQGPTADEAVEAAERLLEVEDLGLVPD